ncbi:MAG: Fpg/Nei family DNA glycosylase [Streptosporangiales bacterium]|nr:Fpg/Nei family DNA glycosylase [Streptosporangiales bacterium]
MPELPDVEGFRRVLAEHGQGRRIERLRVLDEGVLREVSPRKLAAALEGRRFAEPGRLGKWLIGRTDGPAVLLHFGMTGGLVWHPEPAERHRHDRVVFQLDDGELCYRDMRKLQGLRLADGDAEVDRFLAGEGPDALTMGRRQLAELLDGSRKQLKALLSDQSAVAGLGNLTIDEILWRARLHPTRRADGLSGDETKNLYSQMRWVLRESVRAARVPDGPSWLTGHRERPGEPCPRCGTPLSKGRRAGRGTVWCSRCQPPEGP